MPTGVPMSDIAGEAEVAGRAPNAALDHGENGRGEFLDGPKGEFDGIIVGKRVPARDRQLADIDARRPDLGSPFGRG